MPEPGWYDDPTGESAQRWWDGERWTEHVSAPSTPQAPQAPTPPAPTPAAPVPPAPAPPPGPSGSATMAGSLPPAAPSFPSAAPAASSGGGSKAPLLIIGAIVVVLAIAGVVAVLLAGGGSSATGIDAGHRVNLSVESDGSWEYEFEAPAGTLVIDVRGDGGFDPVAYLQDESGRELAMNDDRSVEHLEEYGGDWLDSLIEIDVSEGRYRLIVEEWSGQAGTGQALFPVVGG